MENLNSYHLLYEVQFKFHTNLQLCVDVRHLYLVFGLGVCSPAVFEFFFYKAFFVHLCENIVSLSLQHKEIKGCITVCFCG